MNKLLIFLTNLMSIAIKYNYLFSETKYSHNCVEIDIDEAILSNNIIKRIRKMFNNNLEFQLKFIIKNRYLEDYDFLTILELYNKFSNYFDKIKIKFHVMNVIIPNIVKFNMFYTDSNIIIYLKLLNQMIKNKIIDNNRNIYVTHNDKYYKYYNYKDLKRTLDDNMLINFDEFKYIKFIILINSQNINYYSNSINKNNLYYQFHENCYDSPVFNNINELKNYIINNNINVKILQNYINCININNIIYFPTIYRLMLLEKLINKEIRKELYCNNTIFNINKEIDEIAKNHKIDLISISEIINETPHKNKYWFDNDWFVQELNIRNELINEYGL